MLKMSPFFLTEVDFSPLARIYVDLTEKSYWELAWHDWGRKECHGLPHPPPLDPPSIPLPLQISTASINTVRCSGGGGHRHMWQYCTSLPYSRLSWGTLLYFGFNLQKTMWHSSNQCGSGSRKPNQCGSMRIRILVRHVRQKKCIGAKAFLKGWNRFFANFGQFPCSSIRTHIPNEDPDPCGFTTMVKTTSFLRK